MLKKKIQDEEKNYSKKKLFLKKNIKNKLQHLGLKCLPYKVREISFRKNAKDKLKAKNIIENLNPIVIEDYMEKKKIRMVIDKKI